MPRYRVVGLASQIVHTKTGQRVKPVRRTLTELWADSAAEACAAAARCPQWSHFRTFEAIPVRAPEPAETAS